RRSSACQAVQVRPSCVTPTFVRRPATPNSYTLSLHDALPIWIKFMKDGVNATPLPTVNTTGYIDHAAFLGTINPDTNKISSVNKIGRAVQQECRDRYRMPSSA